MVKFLFEVNRSHFARPILTLQYQPGECWYYGFIIKYEKGVWYVIGKRSKCYAYFFLDDAMRQCRKDDRRKIALEKIRRSKGIRPASEAAQIRAFTRPRNGHLFA